jgi:hypothetical protein
MRVEESIYIERPADEVFAFFDDRRNDGRWMATVHESEWIDLGEQTAIGRRGRMVMDAMGTREFTDVVTAYEPGREVAPIRWWLARGAHRLHRPARGHRLPGQRMAGARTAAGWGVRAADHPVRGPTGQAHVPAGPRTAEGRSGVSRSRR